MYTHFFKRLFDILIGLCVIPFVFFVIIIFAPIIYLTDKGPVFYNAIRAGKGYKPFKMLKLRSMYINSPDVRNTDGSTFNSDNDPRVTPIGRFMRKTSIDEIPQIINVLIGNMSFIGPRPKVFTKSSDIVDMNHDHQDSYSVKPGITGYAQAYYRNSITNEEKFQWDVYYANNVSFSMDMKIIFKTIKSVFLRENINTEQSYLK